MVPELTEPLVSRYLCYELWLATILCNFPSAARGSNHDFPKSLQSEAACHLSRACDTQWPTWRQAHSHTCAVMSIGCSLFWTNTELAYWAGEIRTYETKPPPSNFEQLQRSGLRALEQLVHLHGLGSGCTQTQPPSQSPSHVPHVETTK